jgi:protoheme IX farnesyltransferase
MLTKPRVIELLLITTVPAMVVAAHGWPSLALIGATLLGGSLAAGGAGAINCYVDRDIDDLMERTSGRPVPAGQIEPPRALVFGIVLEIISFAFLATTVNLLSAMLAVGATLFYVFVYTIWLKRATPSNIVIGGAAGAAPVLVGWAAVTGRVGLPALVMFAIIFFWTPPHFWALSLRYTEDYAAAKVPMLPVVRGAQATARHILLYTLSLLGVSLLLYPLGSLGPIYLGSAVVLGVLFVRRALALQRNVEPGEAMRLFRFSIAHLSLLFIAMAADRLIGGPGSDVAYRVTFIAGAVLFCASQAAIIVEDLRWRGKGPVIAPLDV